MIRIDSALQIDGRSPQEVFDFVADFRNEARWNDFNRNPRLIGGAGIGVGTRFAAENVKMGPVEVEIVEYRRPDHLDMRISVGMGTMRFTADFQPTPTGTRMVAVNALELRGVYWLASPLVGMMMRREQPKHQADLKKYLETADVYAPA